MTSIINNNIMQKPLNKQVKISTTEQTNFQY